MPSDIVGAETMDKERNFNFVKGPVFANIVLADEINRTPPKTQAALLESMQEYFCDDRRTALRPATAIFVLATQNPHRGRKVPTRCRKHSSTGSCSAFSFDYPTYQQELDIVKMTTADDIASVSKILSAEDIQYFHTWSEGCRSQTTLSSLP